ncbi:EspA/EspE family type VII secretion system effector [Mycolicibacterium sp. PDY-3]|uniref:TPR repeat region-containing protein n=1 Tax=Mycolicibacterium sp. PDY-3 TaxID=3376069 RepID=UPI0037997591
MGALEGFLSTWDKARQTFGAGVPQTGEQFDQSAQLQQLQSTVQTAAPGSAWSGTAANAYGEVNKEHARVLGELAVLDRRLANHVNESANVVATGRQNLDNLRQWVVDAAASVPPGKNREQLILPIVQKGLGELSGIVSTSNSELNRVAGDITKLGTEWDALQDQKFGGAGKEDKPEQRDDEVQLMSNEEEMSALPLEEQAARDVEDALSGDDPGSAERVGDVLDSIQPGTPLTPEQNAYLSQMQKQQKGMSIDELTNARDSLGDNKGILADSWQLMSNDDVVIDGADGPIKGSAEQLPDSVQNALNNAGSSLTGDYGGHGTTLQHGKDITDIANIVKDGDPRFQTGTELDRKLIVAADKIMDVPDQPGTYDDRKTTAQAIFEAIDDDHQIINDQLMGRNGVDVNDFLHDINTTEWEDNGKAAGYLFSWTGEVGPDGQPSQMATEAADVYAQYIGEHRPELMNIDGQTLGQLNPELAQRYAHGLVPFVDEMAGVGNTQGFEIDTEDAREDGLMPNAKGVFAVLNTDENAAGVINEAAYQEAIKHETAFALNPHDPSAQSHMYAAATMRGLVDVGAHEAFQAFQSNGYEAAVNETQWKKNGFDAALAGLSTGASTIPGVGVVAGPVIGQVGSVFGQQMFESQPPPLDRSLPEMTTTRASEQILNSMLASGNPLTLPEGWVDRSDPQNPRVDRPAGVTDDVYSTTLNAQVGEQTSVSNAKGPDEIYVNRYNNVIQDPDTQPTPEAGG